MTPAAAFVNIGRKRFPVLASYSGRLTCNQETCYDMWKICKNTTRKEIVACMSDPLKAKAEAEADKTREHALFVCVFANWL